jgi:hypothetical protein
MSSKIRKICTCGHKGMNTSGNSAYQILGRRLLLLACGQCNSSRSLSCQRVHPDQWNRCDASRRQLVKQTALLLARAVSHLQGQRNHRAGLRLPYVKLRVLNPIHDSLRSCVAPLLPPSLPPPPPSSPRQALTGKTGSAEAAAEWRVDGRAARMRS